MGREAHTERERERERETFRKRIDFIYIYRTLRPCPYHLLCRSASSLFNNCLIINYVLRTSAVAGQLPQGTIPQKQADKCDSVDESGGFKLNHYLKNNRFWQNTNQWCAYTANTGHLCLVKNHKKYVWSWRQVLASINPFTAMMSFEKVPQKCTICNP